MSISLFDQPLPHGITLACRAAGRLDAAQRAIFLHGFPEAAFVWDEVMAALAPQLRCVAPNLRGYAGSSAPAEASAYQAKYLAADLTALIDSVAGPGRAIDLLVAHDWGGGLAWTYAALQPQRIKRLVIINAPHPGAFQRELRDNPAQQAASAYMLALLQPGAAARLAADDFAGLFQVLTRHGDAPWLTPAVRQQYREVWRQGLEPALNYYRQTPLRPPAGPQDTALHDLLLPPAVLHVQVPTTVLWGEGDLALLSALLDGLDAWVPGVQIHRRPDASHWLVHEQPQWVIGHLQSLLKAD